MLLSIWEIFKEAIIGGLFGLVVGFFNHARKNNRKLLMPRKLKNSLDLGFLYDCMESSMGAIALVIVLGPNDWVRVLLVALIGGMNANEVFQFLFNRLKQLTTKDIDKTLDKVIVEEEDEQKDAK